MAGWRVDLADVEVCRVVCRNPHIAPSPVSATGDGKIDLDRGSLNEGERALKDHGHVYVAGVSIIVGRVSRRALRRIKGRERDRAGDILGLKAQNSVLVLAYFLNAHELMVKTEARLCQRHEIHRVKTDKVPRQLEGVFCALVDIDRSPKLEVGHRLRKVRVGNVMARDR